MELVAIPAPPHGEQARAEWLAARFAEAGLSDIETDAAGNVLGILPARICRRRARGRWCCFPRISIRCFPPARRCTRCSTAIACKLRAPATTRPAWRECWPSFMRCCSAGVELPAPLAVLGNVGEEGEGDLRGVRHFYEHSALAGRVAAHIVLDGAGADAAVTQALGSRRYRGHHYRARRA